MLLLVCSCFGSDIIGRFGGRGCGSAAAFVSVELLQFL
jgi:hypothetical protein